MATLLTTGTDYVNAGESAVVTATLYDTDAETLAKAAIATLTMDLVDESGDTINSRSGVDVLDASIGTLASDGTVTLKLAPEDNASVYARTEIHYLTLTWTWDDDDGDTLTGKEVFEIVVKRPTED